MLYRTVAENGMLIVTDGIMVIHSSTCPVIRSGKLVVYFTGVTDVVMVMDSST
jgi:hypothetical protein